MSSNLSNIRARGRGGRMVDPSVTNVAERRKPNSVRPRPTRARRRRDDHSSSPVIDDGIQQPTRKCVERAVRSPTSLALGVVTSLFGLAPCGVLPATDVATGAVRSYRTFSPLPAFAPEGREGRRYVFCATVLQVTLTGRYPAHCPAEFGLSSRPLSPLAGLRRDGRSSSLLRR